MSEVYYLKSRIEAQPALMEPWRQGPDKGIDHFLSASMTFPSASVGFFFSSGQFSFETHSWKHDVRDVCRPGNPMNHGKI